ncbi:MAG: hypothetical protein M3Y42_16300 [Actinomycetota bacterium]|nr:hypothetical protein [Actinomycetota bacterium]
MIALAGYQFAEFRRSRYWIMPLTGYLIFLLAFFLRISRNTPGAYGRGTVGLFGLAVALTWTLCASQDRAAWQITVVSAGSRDRAQLSRIVLSFAMLVPAAVLSVLVAAGDRLAHGNPVPALVGALLLYLLVAAAGCTLGSLVGRRSGVRSIVPVSVAAGLLLLALLL